MGYRHTNTVTIGVRCISANKHKKGPRARFVRVLGPISDHPCGGGLGGYLLGQLSGNSIVKTVTELLALDLLSNLVL